MSFILMLLIGDCHACTCHLCVFVCVCVVGILLLLKTVVALVRDEGVHWGIQNGLYLSRSTIVYFKHNDMESLRNTLEKVTQENKRAEKVRRYIVVEALYQVSFSR